jgi:hypothetical protein
MPTRWFSYSGSPPRAVLPRKAMAGLRKAGVWHADVGDDE